MPGILIQRLVGTDGHQGIIIIGDGDDSRVIGGSSINGDIACAGIDQIAECEGKGLIQFDFGIADEIDGKCLCSFPRRKVECLCDLRIVRVRQGGSSIGRVNVDTDGRVEFVTQGDSKSQQSGIVFILRLVGADGYQGGIIIGDGDDSRVISGSGINGDIPCAGIDQIAECKRECFIQFNF